ncbi:MAG TPA: beta-xylosidase [Pseudonocardiaceae bacterium]|nr:beta-xylosidase [Pseudonocardiaceae bacterium]
MSSVRGRLSVGLVLGAGLTLLVACGGSPALPEAAGGHPAIGAGGGATSTAPGTPAPTTLHTGNSRGNTDVVASGGPDAPYNYAPSVLRVGNSYRMWWCSQLPGAARPGDEIVSATSASPDGPFTGSGGAPADVQFGNSPSGFDSLHTCDPSVIAVGGVYYLYYTGTSDPAGDNNSIGLATSTDGVHWTRANGGRPIVSTSGEVHRANAYGAGQPSAVYLDGWYYLMFTDTTGGAAASNGAGQFVLRAKDAALTNTLQALGPNGFGSVPSTFAPRRTSILAGFTADWMWVDALNAFAIAADTGAGTTITFWDADFRYHPYNPIQLDGAWKEGPGFVRRADGHAPVNTTDPCGRVSFDFYRATQQGAGPTGIAHFGVDALGVSGCATTPQALDVLNGFVLPSPQRTVYLVADGVLVEVERRSVALALANGMTTTSVPALAKVTVAATVPAGVQALTAPGRPVALLASDGRLWTVGSTALAALNSSPVTTVSTGQWDAYPRGFDLAELRG